MTAELQAAAEPALPPAKPPRIWPVFVAPVAALAGAILTQVVVAVVLVIWLLKQGVAPQQLAAELTSLLTTPTAVILFGLLAQVAIGLAALIPARLSPVPALQRLRLVKPALPAWGYLTFAIGSLGPLAVGVGLAIALAQVLPADPSVAALYRQMTLPVAIPFILFIALAPGLCEELLFRGYVQSRLLQRWPASLAIGVTSVMFALSHITPHAVVNALVLGIWLGVLAWRTGSVWPGVVCHAFVNGAWNVWQIARRLADQPSMPPTPVLVGLGVVVLICFLLSCRLLVRARPVAHEVPGGQGEPA